MVPWAPGGKTAEVASEELDTVGGALQGEEPGEPTPELLTVPRSGRQHPWLHCSLAFQLLQTVTELQMWQKREELEKHFR